MFDIAKRYTLEDIKNFIEGEEGNGCKLISNHYKNIYTKLIIKCACGNEFITTFGTFKSRLKRQCNKCTKKNRNFNPMNYNQVKNFVENNSNCKLLSKTYNGIEDKLEFKCGCGNKFITTFYSFRKFNKRQCNKCSQISKGLNHRHSYEYVKKFIEIESNSGCKLLSKEYIGVNELLKIQCKCGEIFEATFHKFKNNYKRQCNSCGHKESLGEKRIKKYLKNIKANYKIEYTFNDCRVIDPLRFDFAILNNDNTPRLLIEYDGEQHYRPAAFGGVSNKVAKERYKKNKKYDNIKNQYCKKNNIELVRIPYWDYKNIENILKKVI